MAKDSVQYDAFISYRHSELDSFVADTLHRQLESFKLPKNVARLKAAEISWRMYMDSWRMTARGNSSIWSTAAVYTERRSMI